ncbi:MAG: hypothetical protein KDC14_05880 [Planctomycetes bacterium]|nr:hypothetical protein [Planctomycetota bacterium]
MQPHWITIALVAALAGAAGATLAHELLPARAGASADAHAALVEPDAEPAEDFGARLRDIEQRIATLELRPAPSLRQVAVAEPVAVGVAAESARPERTAAEALSEPELREQVEEALAVIREEERVAREQEKEQKRIEQFELQLEKVSTALGLGTDQVNDLRTLYEAQRLAKLDLQRMWDEGFDRELVAQTKDDNAARFRTELERILTPAQLDEFDVLNGNRKARRDVDELQRRRPKGK